MSSVNKVTILGNVSQDVECRSFQNGGRVANFSVATSEQWKKDGKKQERTQFHRIVVLNEHLVDICEKYVNKGDKIYLTGTLETRKYEQNGVEKYTTEIMLRPYNGEIVLLGDKRQTNSGNSESSRSHNNTSYDAPATDSSNDIDIPF